MTPDDVFHLVVTKSARTHNLIVAGFVSLSSLVVLQIVFKVIIFRRVLAVLARVEKLLSMVEQHGVITDAQTKRTGDALDKIESETPAKVAEVVKEVVRDVIPPVVDPLNPPQRRSTDR